MGKFFKTAVSIATGERASMKAFRKADMLWNKHPFRETRKGKAFTQYENLSRMTANKIIKKQKNLKIRLENLNKNPGGKNYFKD